MQTVFGNFVKCVTFCAIRLSVVHYSQYCTYGILLKEERKERGSNGALFLGCTDLYDVTEIVESRVRV